MSIQLLESPIPAAPPAPAAPPSQKASSDDISGTKRGSIDPLVSKQPELFGRFWGVTKIYSVTCLFFQAMI